ncbi:MAG: ZIP family metal transporter [Candidatus Aenigmarchaeota archaeon]|nr:ZIP family metal transporter [Candidatus Aenigmarchaeota archaeon]
MVLLWIILATIVDGLVSLVGAFSMFIRDNTLHKLLMVLVAFSAGSLLSGAFFHLITETLEHLNATETFAIFIVGFSMFFLMERILHWHHCHKGGECEVHSFTYLILLGDGLHNFIDGLVIAASFLIGVPFGIITTILIIGHEIPQELGDFGVLVYGGFNRFRALLFNFVSQLTCVAGGIAGFMLGAVPEFIVYLLPFAAGGFVYISASDLIPELHREADLKKSMTAFAFFLIGVGFMLGIKMLFGH